MISEEEKSFTTIAKAVDCQIPNLTPFSSQLTLGCSICQKYALTVVKACFEGDLYYVLMKLEIGKKARPLIM